MYNYINERGITPNRKENECDMIRVKVIKKNEQECVREVYINGVHKSTVIMKYDKNGYLIDEVTIRYNEITK